MLPEVSFSMKHPYRPSSTDAGIEDVIVHAAATGKDRDKFMDATGLEMEMEIAAEA